MFFKYEKKVLEWIEKNIYVFYFLGITLLSLVMRYGFRDFVSGDMACFLLPWHQAIDDNGGFFSLNQQVGDYNILYQSIIAFFTYLPINPIYEYKILSCVFDYLLAAVVGYFAYDISTDHKMRNGLLAYALVCISPIVVLNSACWGQCDAIYTAFCVASLVLFTKEKYSWSFLIYGVAFSFKLQAVFLLPFYLFIYVRKKSFSVLNFLWIPAAMIISGLPGLIMGRSIKDVFLIYLSQTDTYSAMFLNYPSFWKLVLAENVPEVAEMMRMPAMLLTVGILSILMLLWLKQKVEINVQNLIYMAFIIVFTCVLFLPSMHERYGFMYEILSIMVFFLYPKTGILSFLLHMLSLRTYGSFLFDFPITEFYFMTIINVVVYLIYIIYFQKQISAAAKKDVAGQELLG